MADGWPETTATIVASEPISRLHMAKPIGMSPGGNIQVPAYSNTFRYQVDGREYFGKYKTLGHTLARGPHSHDLL
jgi:hypothetical protein